MGWDLATHGFEGTNPQIFAATKAGVLGFTRSFAKSVGPEIRVNLVSPGWISTAFAEDHMDAEYRQTRISEIPLARFGRPEDVAAAVVFLASDDSSYLTGEAIKINGGLV
jgi:3-oxoacyl-[acyl-carrier protein] reductase